MKSIVHPSMLALLAPAALTAACSVAPGNEPQASAPSTPPAAAAHAPSPATAVEGESAHFTRAIPPSASTWVTLDVTPGAACTFDWAGASDSDNKLSFYADDDGKIYVPVHVIDPRATSATAKIDCNDASGAHQTYGVDLVVDAAAQPAPAPVQRVGHIRPALEGDPMALSREELVARGFPPRPDPVRSPGRYAKWLRRVTHPINVIEPKLVDGGPGGSHRARGAARPRSNGGPEISTGTAAGWSGLVTDVSGDTWGVTEIYGSWVVPSTTAGNFSNYPQVAIWVGFDGAKSKDVLQAGTWQTVSNNNGVVATNLYAWTEWFKDYPKTIANFNIHVGDTVDVGVKWTTDFGQLGYATLWDDTQNTSVGPIKIYPPDGVKFVDDTAEWIVEAPCTDTTCNDHVDLANYGTVTMTSMGAWDITTGTEYDPTGSLTSNVTMVGTGKDTLSACSAGNDGTSMTCTWYNPN